MLKLLLTFQFSIYFVRTLTSVRKKVMFCFKVPDLVATNTAKLSRRLVQIPALIATNIVGQAPDLLFKISVFCCHKDGYKMPQESLK